MTNVILQCALISVLGIGICCLLFAKKIQMINYKVYTTWLARMPNPFVDWMKAPEYVWVVRVAGCLFITMFLISELVMFINNK